MCTVDITCAHYIATVNINLLLLRHGRKQHDTYMSAAQNERPSTAHVLVLVSTFRATAIYIYIYIYYMYTYKPSILWFPFRESLGSGNEKWNESNKNNVQFGLVFLKGIPKAGSFPTPPPPRLRKLKTDRIPNGLFRD